MARHIKAGSITSAWKTLLAYLIDEGEPVSPRGFQTKEILNVTLEVTEGLNNIIVSKVRNLNYRFMIAEWLWIQAGCCDVETLAKYNSVMRKFSDDGYILSGAYGPRLHPQWEYIIKSLKESSESRQAVSTIWTPSPLNSKDIPCTISMQWLIRKGLLHCTVNMRSSDVWLGIPYDFFSFSQVTNVLSATVGVPVGSITMNLASSHLYLNNEKAALEAISEPGITCIRSPQLKYPLDRAGMVSILDQNAYLKVPLRGFWISYAIALQRDSSHALDTLSYLTSIGGHLV